MNSNVLREPPVLHKHQVVCGRLGIGYSTFKNLIRTGELNAVRIGRSVRVSEAEVARFIGEREGRTSA